MDADLRMSGIAEQIALQEPRLAQQEGATTREERFAALVERQARFVFRVVYSILRNVQDSDDVVQETFLKLYRSAAWERIANERAFLARVAWRTAVDQLKKARNDAPACEAPWAGQNPEQAAIASDCNSTVRRLVDGLPEELRQPLALSSVEELTSREIGQVMGIPEGTVRTRIMRARQILKQRLAATRTGNHE
jgi:RNA polymerase sigma-70 factor, ECF subfamily